MWRSRIMNLRMSLYSIAFAAFGGILLHLFDVSHTVILGIAVVAVYVHHIVKIDNLESDVEYLSSRINELEEQGGYP